MGNTIVFGDRKKYITFEATLGCCLLLLAIVGVTAIFLIYCLFCKIKKDSSTDNNCDNCCNCGKCNCCNDCCTSCCKKCKEFCTSRKHFHKILELVFSSISELYVKSEFEDHANIGDSKTAPVSTTGDQKPAPVLIVSERKLPHGCTECCTYLYFSYMLLMSAMWFLTMLVELSIYRKTGTCNDINVEVRSFSCFDVDNNYEKIDCENTPDIETRRVICYLYSPTVAGIGVAFSVAKLISVLGDIAYNLILGGMNNNCCNSFCFWCFIILRILGIALVVVIFVIFMVVAHVNRIFDTNYFTYGGIPMRYMQVILLLATAVGILALPPWKKYSDKDYTTKYRHLGYKDVSQCIIGHVENGNKIKNGQNSTSASVSSGNTKETSF